jgi:hypothetical protein
MTALRIFTVAKHKKPLPAMQGNLPKAKFSRLHQVPSRHERLNAKDYEKPQRALTRIKPRGAKRFAQPFPPVLGEI